MDKNVSIKLHDSKLNSTRSDQQWYVSIHPVTIIPNKYGKLRRVCNAESKSKGVSLNEKMIAGLELLQSLIGIVSWVEKLNIVLITDIDAMFLQIKVPIMECNFLKFLKKDNPTKPLEVFEYTRHAFGAKSSTTCANYAHH